MSELKRGDFVRISIGTWSKNAMVGIASENGDSIAVLFDGMAPVTDEMFAMGFMALSRGEDRVYRELMFHTEVTVERKS